MPSGASGPVNGSGAPNRITSSALTGDPEALQDAIAMAVVPSTTDQWINFEPDIHTPHFGTAIAAVIQHGKSRIRIKALKLEI